MSHLLVLCTCPDLPSAGHLARELVQARLAACVSILPQIHSFYEWQGTLHEDKECQLLIKTQTARYAELQEKLLELHPYDVPEIIAIPLHAGLPAYLGWIEQQTEKTP